MRIVLATEVFSPSIGGTERHVEHLAEALLAGGHHVIVATTSPGGGALDPPHVRRLSGWSDLVIRRRARPEQRFHPPAPDPGAVAELVAICRAERADLIHAHGWIAHSAVRAAARCQIPVVVGLHDYGLDCAVRSRLRDDGSTCEGPQAGGCRSCAAGRYGAVRGPLVVAGLRRSQRWWDRVDAFVANSDAVAAAAQLAGVSCAVASPWIAPRRLPDPSAAPVDLPPGPFVSYVGALAAHKGIATLASAWADPAPSPLVALVSRPEAGAPALPRGTVVHHGASHPEVLATLARAAVTVVPSHFPEPFGLVATEAMWAGSVVVASDVGGLATVLDHGRSGVLVPAGDASALRGAIRELLADPARHAALAAAGRQRATDLDGTAAIVAVYERVLAAQPQALAASLRT